MSALSKTTHRGPDGAQRTRLRPVGGSRVGTRPDIEIVVPVYNEESTLEVSVFRLHHFLEEYFPLSWQIVIADNAGDVDPSTDLRALLPLSSHRSYRVTPTSPSERAWARARGSPADPKRGLISRA